MTYAAPRRQFGEDARPLRSLAIEGWRGINHSFALVNQHQILELLKLDGLRLYHRDLPFAFSNWTRASNGSGLSEDQQRLIDALGPPDNDRVDCVYRIGSPFRAGAEEDRRKTITFMVTELGLTPKSFEGGDPYAAFFTRDDNAIVTPSRWSRDRLVEWGFPETKIDIVPHGVDGAVFRPMSVQERQVRRRSLGLGEDETVFLNVGLSSWNKGVDLVLVAFATLRAAGRKVRLILKDQRELYGLSVETLIQRLGTDCPALVAADTLSAISVIPTTISGAELRGLFGIADCYVSPYRAEGFNLPVLESIACGTPVIVTRGGATDDFCGDDVALRISGAPGSREDPATGAIGRFIEPNSSELIEAMDCFTTRGSTGLVGFDEARARVTTQFTWKVAAQELARLTLGPFPDADDIADTDHRSLHAPIVRAIGQRDILDLIAVMRPMAMARTPKVRVGNDYDGGYVLPAIALQCDAVLSIGVGPDVSFDLDLAVRGARVAQFDHTVDRPPTPHANFSFHKRGWGTKTEGDFLSFGDILDDFSRLSPRRALLKFDIEGAEYDVINAMDVGQLQTFEVIVCEFHDFQRLSEPDFYHRARICLEKLNTLHTAVHLHANNYGGMSLVAGIAMPNVVELSFLRRDLDDFPGRCWDTIPGPLDRPNNPYSVDLHLKPF